MAVRPVVHQVDGGQQLGGEEGLVAVKKQFPFLSMDSALYLGPIIIQFIECDPGLDVRVEVLHVKHLITEDVLKNKEKLQNIRAAKSVLCLGAKILICFVPRLVILLSIFFTVMIGQIIFINYLFFKI